MRTLTIASQNSVGLRDMGVATSASRFFRQIGGTLGTAVLLSLMFGFMPAKLQTSFTNEVTLSASLDAALDPSVADAPENAEIMNTIYTSFLTEIVGGATAGEQTGVDQATDAATAAVQAQVDAGALPAVAPEQATATAVTQARAAALEQMQMQMQMQMQAQLPVARLSDDGIVSLDFSDATERQDFVAGVVPRIESALDSGNGASVGGDTLNDTSFLMGADIRFARPFLVALNASAVTVYWVAMFIVAIAFILALFFRTPPLRKKSALQEAAADDAAMSA